MAFISLQIVWDEATKKWVNKDEDPAEAESFKPPPKMGDIKMPAMQPMQQQPNSIPPSSAIPAMQPNQFAQQQQHTAAAAPVATPSMPMSPYGVQAPQQAAVNSMPMQTQQQQQPVADQPAPPSAPNMFKMQKGRSELKEKINLCKHFKTILI
jgi:hypothetical protein